jgi:hypothetical protein
VRLDREHKRLRVPARAPAKHSLYATKCKTLVRENGLLVEAGNVGTLAEALTRLLRDPSLQAFRQRMQKIWALCDDLHGRAALRLGLAGQVDVNLG